MKSKPTTMRTAPYRDLEPYIKADMPTSLGSGVSYWLKSETLDDVQDSGR